MYLLAFDEMSVEIVPLASGGETLLLDGQKFHCRLNTHNKTYWKCARRKCAATAITTGQNGQVRVVKETPHTHNIPRSYNEVEDYESDDELADDEHDIEEDEEPANDEHEEADDEPVDDVSETEEEAEDESDDTGDDIEQSEKEIEWVEWVERSSDDESDAEETSEMEEESADDEYDVFGKVGNAPHDVLIDHTTTFRRDIRLLREPSPKIRGAVLEDAPKGLICFLNEICLNLLRGYFSLSTYETQILENFKESIQLMASEHEEWREKRKLLNQHSTDPFLSVLLNLLAASQSFCK